MASRLFAACLAIFFGATTSQAASLDVKGYRIGMPLEELRELNRTYSAATGNLTVGGVPMLGHPPFYIKLHEGKLDTLALRFSASRFSEIEAAVRTKYPEITCESSTVTTGAGVTLEQRKCTVLGDDSTLIIERYGYSAIEGSLHLFSHRSVEAEKARRATAVTDL